MTVRIESNAQLTPEQERVYRLRNALERDGGTPGGFLEILAAVVADGTWRQVPSGINAEEPFESFAKFVEAKPPFGLGQSVEDVHTLLQIRHPHEGAPEVRAKMDAMRIEVTRLLARDGITGYTDQQRGRDIQAWAALDRAGGWWLGFFVACQIHVGTGGARGSSQHNHRAAASSAKISASEFAHRAGTSADRVLRYYRAWEAAKAAGAVTVGANELYPGHEPVALPPAEDWTLYYTSRKSASTDRGALISAAAAAEGIRPTKALEVAENPTALRAAILADPKTAQAAKAALSALAAEERKVEHIGLVRQAAEDGKARTPTGQIIDLPEQSKAEAAQHLALVEDPQAEPEVVSAAYQAVQALIAEAVDADPVVQIGERRSKIYSTLKTTTKNISSIDPDQLTSVLDDDLRESFTQLRETVNALADLITQTTLDKGTSRTA